MKLTLKILPLPTRLAFDQLIHSRLLALGEMMRIAHAVVNIDRPSPESRDFRASVALQIPGPDLKAVQLASHPILAFTRACEALEEQWKARLQARVKRQRARRHSVRQTH